jgi:hypothetical protein
MALRMEKQQANAMAGVLLNLTIHRQVEGACLRQLFKRTVYYEGI